MSGAGRAARSARADFDSPSGSEGEGEGEGGDNGGTGDVGGRGARGQVAAPDIWDAVENLTQSEDQEPFSQMSPRAFRRR